MTTLSLPYTWEKKKTLNPELLELVRELSI